MHRPFFPILLLLGAALSSVFAVPGEFKPSETSAKATWFAHVNLITLRSSEIGRKLIGELDNEAKRQLRQLERMLNFHPVEDLESATFYGTSSDPEKAVALIRGEFDVERLKGVVKDGDDYMPMKHNQAIIHSWKDSGHRIYATIANDRLIIIGPDLDLLRSAADVIIAGGAALDESKIFGHEKSDRSPILVASADLAALGTLEIDSSLVRKIKSVSISVGENNGELLALASLKTADTRSAELVEQMLNGVLALAEASEEFSPEIVQAFKTKLTGTGISLSISLPLNQFKDLVAKLEKAAEGLK
ncbi:MAG: hypothetical protein ACI8XO_002004 [Verrucomicrobiales bacterium]|jgi:hypothetical protein